MCVMTMFCTCNRAESDEEKALVTKNENKSSGFWANPLNKLSVGSGVTTVASATFTLVAHEYLASDWAIGGGVICFLSLCTLIASTCPTQRRAIEKMSENSEGLTESDGRTIVANLQV